MSLRHVLLLVPFLAAGALRAAVPAQAPAAAFDESKLLATYAADQSPQDLNVALFISLQLRADHTFTLRKYAKVPDSTIDHYATGTWKLAGDVLTISLATDDQGKPIDPQTIAFTVAQDGRVLINTKPLAVLLAKDFASPRFPPASVPATGTAPAPAPAPGAASGSSTAPQPR